MKHRKKIYIVALFFLSVIHGCNLGITERRKGNLQNRICLFVETENARLEFSSLAHNEYYILDVSKFGSVDSASFPPWIKTNLKTSEIYAERNTNPDCRYGIGKYFCTKGKVAVEYVQQAPSVKVFRIEYASVGSIAPNVVSENGRYIGGSSTSGSWVVDLWGIADTSDTGIRTVTSDAIRYYPTGIRFGNIDNNGILYSYFLEKKGNGYVAKVMCIDRPVEQVFEAGYNLSGIKGEELAGIFGRELLWVSSDGTKASGNVMMDGKCVECSWSVSDSGKATGRVHLGMPYEHGYLLSQVMSSNGNFVGLNFRDSVSLLPYVRVFGTDRYISLGNEGILTAITDDGIAFVAGNRTSVYDLLNPSSGPQDLLTWLSDRFAGFRSSQIEKISGNGLTVNVTNGDATTIVCGSTQGDYIYILTII